MQIKTLESSDLSAWNAFVEECSDATFFHRGEWRNVIARAFGHRPHYLYAERDGQITAVLPLFHVKTLLFSNALTSVPFCMGGGAVATHAEDRQALVDAACKLAEELKVDHLELRNQVVREEGWPGKDLYVNFSREISQDSDENMMAIPRKQRAMVRKGIKAGLTASIGQDTATLYQCYSESVRNLGTPVFAKKYLDILVEEFANDCEILVVNKDDQAVASVMSFYFKDQVLPYYGGGTLAARNLYANDFMYWQVMETARAKGVRIFDYGRSKVDSGSYRFKKHWGFEPVPMAYSYYLVKAKDVPNLSPNNPKYKLFVDGWRKMPLAISTRVGPWLARQLG